MASTSNIKATAFPTNVPYVNGSGLGTIGVKSIQRRPMFSYYGGKGRLSRYYPYPKYSTIIEPFAGAAWYSVYWQASKAHLFDKSDIVCKTWEWLIHEAVPDDLMAFPPYTAKTRMVRHEPAGKDYFYRWWGNMGSVKPANVASSYNLWPREKSIARLLTAKNWTIINGNYTEAPDVEATWFIDPPYQSDHKGDLYEHHEINYSELSEWCRSRKGQVIVCDREGADWLPFVPLPTRAPRAGRNRTPLREMYWTNLSK